MVRIELDNLMGEPDGPTVFIPELGVEVPTFVDPRDDLIPDSAKGQFQRLSHHVPFKMRGDYKPAWLPDGVDIGDARVDKNGLVLCNGTTKDGSVCHSRAVNRSGRCRNHGGALHPADKVLSAENIAIGNVDAGRLAKLDRVQRFMNGTLTVDELDDDEIQGCFVRNDQGQEVKGGKLGVKFEQNLTKELHRRLNRFLRSRAPSMLHVMVDIAESELVEAADRIKAAQWVAERTMGKTPDVIIHSATDKPYESIFERLESGSREDHRTKRVESARSDQQVSDDAVVDVDAEVIDIETDASYSEPEHGSPEDHGISPFVPVVDPHTYADEILRRRDEAKALRKRIANAKRKRFAARAVGARSLDTAPWLIDWQRLDGAAGKDGSGGFLARVVPPMHQDKRTLDRLTAS